nr:hypothetical protein [Sphingomonas sp. CDS-1]
MMVRTWQRLDYSIPRYGLDLNPIQQLSSKLKTRPQKYRSDSSELKISDLGLTNEWMAGGAKAYSSLKTLYNRWKHWIEFRRNRVLNPPEQRDLP